MMSSDESEYTSADEKDGDSDSLDKIKRPDYLTGTSESSLIDDSSRYHQLVYIARIMCKSKFQFKS